MEVIGLSAGYGKLPVLHGVSFAVPSRSLTTILGPNGAGKTTLVKSLVALTDRFSGHIRFKERPIDGLPTHVIVGLGIGFVPQTASVFPSLSVQENLEMGCRLLLPARRPQRIAEIYGQFPRLAQRQHQRASTLSGGERQMLAIGSALLADPEFIILDEPITGLSPQLVDEVVEGIEAINDRGTTVLWVVEQNPQQVLAIADWAIVMEGGTIKTQMPAGELLAVPDFRTVFLGV
jgi:branched-chain amino acid transport system ATP-binding protein